MATSTPTATAATAPAAPRSSKLLVVLAIVLLLVVVAGAAGAYWFLNHNGRPQAQAQTPPPEKPIFITLEPITVNLQSEGRSKFLHVGMALKVRDEQAKAQIEEFMPELRSRALLMLSNRQPDSLLSTDAKAALAEEIRTELNRPLSDNQKPQGIVSISFNTFVVQ